MEITFGDRAHFASGHPSKFVTHYRSYDELWHKENMINIGLSRLPEDWEYVAWIDADVHFAREDWVEETINQLQHYMVVQMFQDAVDLGPNHETLHVHKGFVASYSKSAAYKTGYHDWHPGFAWAARREAIEALGGLIDFAILGSADRHMACALIGRASESLYPHLSESYKKGVLQWQTRADRYIKRDVGYVPGTLLHDWHGRKIDRQYGTRWQILERNHFDPELDLKRDSQGLWQLEVHEPRQFQLRDDIRRYFRTRNEDSIDLE